MDLQRSAADKLSTTTYSIAHHAHDERGGRQFQACSRHGAPSVLRAGACSAANWSVTHSDSCTVLFCSSSQDWGRLGGRGDLRVPDK
eukprot:1883192-Pleurochrysis_carterae.AAC.1